MSSRGGTDKGRGGRRRHAGAASAVRRRAPRKRVPARVGSLQLRQRVLDPDQTGPAMCAARFLPNTCKHAWAGFAFGTAEGLTGMSSFMLFWRGFRRGRCDRFYQQAVERRARDVLRMLRDPWRGTECFSSLRFLSPLNSHGSGMLHRGAQSGTELRRV